MIHFAPNWRPWTLGVLTVVAGVIASEPSLVSFMPVGWQVNVIGAAKLAVAVLGGLGLMTAKDSNVTGGTVPATDEAADRCCRALACRAPNDATPGYASTVIPPKQNQ